MAPKLWLNMKLLASHCATLIYSSCEVTERERDRRRRNVNMSEVSPFDCADVTFTHGRRPELLALKHESRIL